MAKANDAPVAAEAKPDLVNVRLLRGYVPESGEFHVSADDIHAGTERETRLYVKRLPGEVLSLPRDEARRAIAEKIAVVDADLV